VESFYAKQFDSKGLGSPAKSARVAFGAFDHQRASRGTVMSKQSSRSGKTRTCNRDRPYLHCHESGEVAKEVIFCPFLLSNSLPKDPSGFFGRQW